MIENRQNNNQKKKHLNVPTLKFRILIGFG